MYIHMTYVPFTGGAPAINALLGGHVTAVLQNYSEIGEQLHSGKLRALATPSAKRIEPLPDLPTVAESGYKDFDAEVSFGMVTTAKTPGIVVAPSASATSRCTRASDRTSTPRASNAVRSPPISTRPRTGPRAS